MSEVLTDPQAEAALLAVCFQSRPARDRARTHVTGADFWNPQHEKVWQAMSRLDREQRPVEWVSMADVLSSEPAALRMLPDLTTNPAYAANVDEYANLVRAWSMRRRMRTLAARVTQECSRSTIDPATLAATMTQEFASVQRTSESQDVTGYTMRELLADPDDEPEWVIPGLLAKGDRMILTGEEGLGKSHLLRQFAIHAAAGLHPFTMEHIRPMRTLIVDCENPLRGFKRKSRRQVAWAQQHGQDPIDRIYVDPRHRMDITRDADLAAIHRLLDAWQPDLMVIGPLYRLVEGGINDDDDASPVLAALDTIHGRDVLLLTEAHAGHSQGKGKVRELRPRGSSALLGWPDFGYGMRWDEERGAVDFVPWRGDRDERNWPSSIRRARDGDRWIEHFTAESD